MRANLTRIVIGLALMMATVARGSEPGGAAAAPVQPRVMLGACELTIDPASPQARSRLGLMLCVKGAFGSEMAVVSGTPEENVWLRYGQVYSGLYLTPWLAFHGRARFFDILPVGVKAVERRYGDTDYVVVQLGNPALHRWRLTMGRVRLPFGIDQSQADELYRSFENRQFWYSPPHGVFVTADDQRALQLEVGLASNEAGSREPGRRHGLSEPLEPAAASQREPGEGGGGEAAPAKVGVNRAVSARMMVDFAALDGSRLVFSGYGDGAQSRRFGAGFVTTSRRDDLTQFEFVRRLTTPDGRTEPFQQLLRIGHVGAWRRGARWVVQFDDERFRFRRGILEHDAQIFPHLLLRMAVSYYKSESGDGVRRWYVTTGLEARL